MTSAAQLPVASFVGVIQTSSRNVDECISRRELLGRRRVIRQPGGSDMKRYARLIAAIGWFALPVATAEARSSSYDGAWSLVFVTTKGACDSQYSFGVNIQNGIVTHPNIVHFQGVVGANGAVRASVTVHEKHASGSGRLAGNTGRGAWNGYSGSSRCSGYWTAQRG